MSSLTANQNPSSTAITTDALVLDFEKKYGYGPGSISPEHEEDYLFQLMVAAYNYGASSYIGNSKRTLSAEEIQVIAKVFGLGVSHGMECLS